jgi:uncharacterized RDD family membrane protein YckC
MVMAPARALARSTQLGRAVRSGVGGVTASAGGMLETEAEKAVEAALAGPLPEAVTRILIEQRVVERIASEFVASGDLERMLASAVEDERTAQLVQRLLASPAVEQMLIDAVESELATGVTERLVQSPDVQRAITDAVRTALARQSASLADSMAASVHRLDGRLEAPPRRWTGRPPRQPATTAAASAVPYAGLGSRAAALAVDAVAVHLIFLLGCAMVGLVVSLTGRDLSGTVGEVLAAAGWFALVVAYFTVFWTAVGQTPGMNLMRLRLVDASGNPPGLTRSLLRLVGALVAVSFVFIGYLPVLVDDRRRALQDFLAGTVVIYDPA